MPLSQCPFLTHLTSNEEMLLLAKTQNHYWALFSQREEPAFWLGAQPSPPASEEYAGFSDPAILDLEERFQAQAVFSCADVTKEG